MNETLKETNPLISRSSNYQDPKDKVTGDYSTMESVDNMKRRKGHKDSPQSQKNYQMLNLKEEYQNYSGHRDNENKSRSYRNAFQDRSTIRYG